MERPEARVGQSTCGGPACDSSGWTLDLVGGVEEIGLESIYEELPTNMPAFLVTLL